jgi:transposase
MTYMTLRFCQALMANASRHRLIYEAFMDGAYDSSKNYALLRGMNIKSIIKPRRNARVDRGPPERRNSAMILKTLGEKAWSRAKGYGRRWSAETEFSNAYMENIAWLKAWKT